MVLLVAKCIIRFTIQHSCSLSAAAESVWDSYSCAIIPSHECIQTVISFIPRTYNLIFVHAASLLFSAVHHLQSVPY